MQNWSGQRGSPAAKTRTALLYHKHDLNKPRAWGWAAIAEYGELSERERGQYILLESFKKYLMPKDFCSECQMGQFASIATCQKCCVQYRCLNACRKWRCQACRVNVAALRGGCKLSHDMLCRADLAALPAALSPLKLVSDFLSCLVNEVVLPTLKDHYGSR